MTTTRAQTTIKSYDKLLIGGEWVTPSSAKVLRVISPATEELLAEVPAAQAEDVDAAVARARDAFDSGPWPRMSAHERAGYLLRLRDELEARHAELVETFSAEVGAPLALSEAFHQLSLDILTDNAHIHEKFVFEEDRPWGENSVHIVKEPVGVVGAIIPWNGPVVCCVLKMGPALAAGCTVVLKSAEEGPVSVMLYAEALEAVGFPPGVVSILPGGRAVGEHLVTHPDVDKIAFTGSTAAGKRIMSLCGERVRNVTLELGGKSAAIIADDIPLDEVLPTMVAGGVGHSGQVCAALTRVLVPRHRQEELLEAIGDALAGWKVGDPRDADTVLGPLVAERQRDRVEGYIKLGIEEGARLAIGGGRPAGLDRGWYVEPTVFADVDNKMRIAQEEIFGPVLVVIPFDSVDEAVDIANDSPYGLSGAVYASDPALANAIARRIRTGQVAINTWGICSVQPFGGYKQSGIGREGGIEGLAPYLETKLIQTV